jgi:hypothetical protein
VSDPCPSRTYCNGTGWCDVCGDPNPDSVTEGTMTDDSGGALITVCPECRDWIETSRCAVCGTRKEGRHKADAIGFHDTETVELSYPVCDGCRTAIGFDPAGVSR